MDNCGVLQTAGWYLIQRSAGPLALLDTSRWHRVPEAQRPLAYPSGIAQQPGSFLVCKLPCRSLICQLFPTRNTFSVCQVIVLCSSLSYAVPAGEKGPAASPQHAGPLGAKQGLHALLSKQGKQRLRVKAQPTHPPRVPNLLQYSLVCSGAHLARVQHSL